MYLLLNNLSSKQLEGKQVKLVCVAGCGGVDFVRSCIVRLDIKDDSLVVISS